jgi:lipoprotein-releasing system ATP-binding protein
MTPAIEAKALSKIFYHPKEMVVLDQIDVTINCGESVAIMGASGEGKTTLLHILGTLETFTSGTLSMMGEEVTAKKAAALRNKTLGFIFQSFYLLEDCTALENVLMPAKIGRPPTHKGSQMDERAKRLLNHVGRAERIQHPTNLLSGGEKQRVAIARAMCNDPDILFADEPSGNLDHNTSNDIHTILLSLVRNQGKTLIVVTHDPELAKMCDRQLTLYNGKLYDNTSERSPSPTQHPESGRLIQA